MTAPYLVLAVGGTGESWPTDTRTGVSGMLLNITNKLDSEQFEGRWVPYDASYGFVPMPNGVSYAESVRRGHQSLLAAIRVDDRPVVLLGYSQGSAVVSSLLDQLDAGYYPGIRARVVGAVLMANPARRLVDDTIGVRVNGYGITYDLKSPNARRTVPTVDVANPEDMICSAAPDSFLRGLSKLTEFMSFTDLRAWGKSLYADMKDVDWAENSEGSGNFRDVPYQINRFARSINEILGYVTGRHTGYNIERVPGMTSTYTEVAARWIEAAASGRALATAPGYRTVGEISA
jgi:hypothetical protein